MPVAKNKCNFGGTSHRLCGKTECDMCHNRSLASMNVDKYATMDIQDNKDKGLSTSTRMTSKGTSIVRYFKCLTVKDGIACNHVFSKRPGDIKFSKTDPEKPTLCPHCGVHCRRICDKEGCEWCIKMISFASIKETFPHIYNAWHKDNPLPPEKVNKFTHDIYKFTCHECDHEFDAALGNVMNQDKGKSTRYKQLIKEGKDVSGEFLGAWCPYCAGLKKCSGGKNCKTCWKKSLDYYLTELQNKDKKMIWNVDMNEDNKPEMFAIKSNEYAHFTCSRCNHIKPAKICNIANGMTCSICDNGVICGKYGCDTCYKNSLASFDPKKLSCWDYTKNPTVNFRTIHLGSSDRYYFKCRKCAYSFNPELYTITRRSGWCPNCNNRQTERTIFEYIHSLYPSARTEVRFSWCRDLTTLPFDTVIMDKKIIIECDGKQHFEVVDWFKHTADKLQEKQERDCFKMLKAIEQGYKIIRIVQIEVAHNKILVNGKQWKDVLKNLLENIDDITEEIIYISKNPNMYDKHIELMDKVNTEELIMDYQKIHN